MVSGQQVHYESYFLEKPPESPKFFLDIRNNRAILKRPSLPKVISKRTMQAFSAKQFNPASGLHARKISNATFSIISLILSTGLLAPPAVWANIFKATSTRTLAQGRLSNQAYAAGEDGALFRRGSGPNVKHWPRRDVQNIASNVIPSKNVASILCPIETKSSINVRLKSYCESQRSPLKPTLGIQDPSLPYLLAPRLGQVSSPTPTLRWNAVAGVRRYQLWLVRQRDRQVVWGTAVEASQITLPSKLKLMPGELYQVVVEADNGTSSRMETCSAGLNFGVLTLAEAQELEKKLTDIRSQRGPGTTPQNLALQEAEALISLRLKAEAFDLLKQHEHQNPSLQGQFLLGDLANSQGLNQQARGYFSQAAALAIRAGDTEGGREASDRRDLTRALAEQAGQGKCGTSRSTVPTRSAP
jgi:hypothetical protein